MAHQQPQGPRHGAAPAAGVEIEDARMTIIEHLAELRVRGVYALGAAIVGAIISWIWVEELFTFLLQPLEVAAMRAGMADKLEAVNYKDIIEPFFTLMKTAMVGGIFLAIPIILYNIWAFVAPGLYKHEKRLAAPFVVLATLFFLMGAGFCYYFVMPYGFQFLLEFNKNVGQPVIMMREHYALSMKLLLAFGAVFELPVLAMFLSALGVITHRTLIKFWRYAVLAAFVFAAVLTPPDVITQLAMAVPLVILYFISIGVAYVFTTRRERAEARARAADPDQVSDAELEP